MNYTCETERRDNRQNSDKALQIDFGDKAALRIDVSDATAHQVGVGSDKQLHGDGHPASQLDDGATLQLDDIKTVCNEIYTEQVRLDQGRGKLTDSFAKKKSKLSSSIHLVNHSSDSHGTGKSNLKQGYQSDTSVAEDNIVSAATEYVRDDVLNDNPYASDKSLSVKEIGSNCTTLQEKQKMQTWLANSVRILLEHLNRYGMCVVDDFLGEDKGRAVFEEVCLLQDKHFFQDGQVMSGGGLHEPSIRSDKITWTDGISPCSSPNLRHLIGLMDSIVLRANRVKNNGDLGKYKINGRTRMMVACYPGGGSHYVKHVDNPNGDGRVVTAIYYLNKDWDSKIDGGSLKIYSQVNKGAVVKIEPMFDRVVFFWSDARNPHEVLPSNRPRYAVTVWYLDEMEKRNYEKSRLRRDGDQQKL